MNETFYIQGPGWLHDGIFIPDTANDKVRVVVDRGLDRESINTWMTIKEAYDTWGMLADQGWRHVPESRVSIEELVTRITPTDTMVFG